MRPKTLFGIAVFLFLLFVFAGDLVLPQPLKSASTNTRNQLNQFVMGLIPGQPKDLNKEREDKLQRQLEQGGSTTP